MDAAGVAHTTRLSVGRLLRCSEDWLAGVLHGPAAARTWVALRPLVGSVFQPVVFLRDDALRGNVYEFVFTDILPFLLS